MDKINFQNGQAGGTPVNATNLNKLQDNVDEGKLDKTGGTINGTLRTTGAIFTPAIEIKANTPYIDFHYGNSTTDYTSRIVETSNGVLQAENLFKAGHCGLVDDAPLGFSYAPAGWANNPFNWTAILLTMQFDVYDHYRQQFAFPCGAGEAGKIAYRVKDNNQWSVWHFINASN